MGGSGSIFSPVVVVRPSTLLPFCPSSNSPANILTRFFIGPGGSFSSSFFSSSPCLGVLASSFLVEVKSDLNLNRGLGGGGGAGVGGGVVSSPLLSESKPEGAYMGSISHYKGYGS